MAISGLIESLNHSVGAGFNVYERRPGDYQLIVPIRHEDGDMIDVYLQDSPRGGGYVRICDFGMTLMRLSYTYEITTPARQQIFENILINNSVSNDAGNLYLDAPVGNLYESILQFVGCAQKVCNPVFPILGVFRLKGQPKRDGSIIVRSCKASQSPVYPIRDAILAVNHASCPSLSSSGPPPMG